MTAFPAARAAARGKASPPLAAEARVEGRAGAAPVPSHCYGYPRNTYSSSLHCQGCRSWHSGRCPWQGKGNGVVRLQFCSTPLVWGLRFSTWRMTSPMVPCTVMLAWWCQKSEREKPQRGRTNQHTLIEIPCNQPAITAFSHALPHCITNTATNNAPYPCPSSTHTWLLVCLLREL